MPRLVLSSLLLLFALFALLAAPMTARADDDWAADVDLLEQAYRELHPGLARYNTPEQLEARFATLRRALAGRHDLAAAFLALSEFAGGLRCGHTYPNFYNQSKAVRESLVEHRRRLPFQFRWIDRRMWISRNQSDRSELIPGTEVVAIEGIPAGTILDRLLPVARADGGNDAKRIAYLEVQGNDAIEAFDVYLPLYFPKVGERIRLTVRAPGATRTRSLVVAGLSRAERLARNGTVADDPAAGWRLDFPRDGVAVLTTPNWALYGSRFDWRGFLDRAYGELNERGIRSLVIDIRRNEGGLDVGDVLLAHLIDAPVARPEIEPRTRYRSTPVALRPYLDTWDPSFNDWGDAAQPLGDGFFRLRRDDDDAPGSRIAPVTPRFAGRVLLLTSAVNSSAAFEFARLLRASGRGTLVGATTGGNLRGINGGAFFFLRLPRTGIEMDLPLIGQFPTTAQDDAGIVPDVAVATTPDDLARGRDAVMERALALAVAVE